jgi:carbamate kinase
VDNKEKKKIAVVAFGGNAILPENQRGTFEEQQTNSDAACQPFVEIVRNGYELIAVHGNGPHVGNLLLQMERAADEVPVLPLYVCGACTQGQIGFILSNSLRKAFHEAGINKAVMVMITSTEVDPADTAFQQPTKPIGLFYNEEKAKQLNSEKGWQLIEDSGRGYRRVVPSPQPKRILESANIKELVNKGNVLVACGGGGIPVIQDRGQFKGVDAVIDKDLASSVLAQEVGAELYVIITSVPQVAINFGKPNMQKLDTITIDEAKQYMAEGHFGAGSMGPKIAAAINFIEAGGKEVLITTAGNVCTALNSRCGGTYIIQNQH